jgi:hypothetical protein
MPFITCSHYSMLRFRSFLRPANEAVIFEQISFRPRYNSFHESNRHHTCV